MVRPNLVIRWFNNPPARHLYAPRVGVPGRLAVLAAALVMISSQWNVASAQPRVIVNYPAMPQLATEETPGRLVDLDDFQLKQFGFLPGELEDDDFDGVPNLDDKCPDTPHDIAHNRVDNAGIDECGCAVPSERLAAEEVQRRLATLVTSDTINFEFDQSRLTPNALALLTDYLARVRGRPLSVLVEGHADAIGSAKYNQALSQRRAETVRRWLRQRDVNAELVKTVGYGESRPAAQGSSVASRMQNRRVELTIKAEAASGLSNFKLPLYGNVANFLQLDCAESQTGLNTNGQRMLNKLAAFLLISPDTSLNIKGEYNGNIVSPAVAEQISRGRAHEVRRYLLEIGVPLYQVQPTINGPAPMEPGVDSRCVTMTLER